MKVFTLPDLGEGLQEAEIVSWHVGEDDEIDVDQPLLSVETEKAVVEIPSPRAGRIARLFVRPGDILQVGDPLVEFAGDDAAAEQNDAASSAPEGATAGSAARAAGETFPHAEDASPEALDPRARSKAVEAAETTEAARSVSSSHRAGGTPADEGAHFAQRAANRVSTPGSTSASTAPSQAGARVMRPPRPATADAGTVVGRVEAGSETMRERPTLTALARATPAVRALARRLDVDLGIVTPSGPNETITARDVERVAKLLQEVGPLEPLRGPRRAMARAMAQARAEVAPVTVNDDANLSAWWPERRGLMLRLIRAIAAASRVEPALNAWFDSHALGRRVLSKVHLGIAVDTPDGLFVPVLRDVGNRSPEDLAAGLERLRRDVERRTIPPEEMRGYTFTLSNFGTFGGRYANPIVQPPTVAILGAGRVRNEMVVVHGAPAAQLILPLSLTFDHRAVTGGEATRFLAAVIRDLEAD